MLGQLVRAGGGDTYPLFQPIVTIGRHPDNDIQLRYKSVSLRHGQLELRDGWWSVLDLESRTGVRVNGVSCHEQQLNPNDVISFGKQRFSILYQLEAGQLDTAQADKTQTRGRQDIEDAAFDFLQSSAPETKPRPEAVEPARTKQQPADYHGTLVPCGGGDPIPLFKPQLLVGRHQKCDICLRFSTVSAHHCRLEFEEGYWFVRDLNSRNGVRVDGKQCESCCLFPGKILWIAKQRYRVDYTPTSDTPPPEEDVFAKGLLEKAGLNKSSNDVARTLNIDDGHVPAKKWSLDDD